MLRLLWGYNEAARRRSLTVHVESKARRGCLPWCLLRLLLLLLGLIRYLLLGLLLVLLWLLRRWRWLLVMLWLLPVVRIRWWLGMLMNGGVVVASVFILQAQRLFVLFFRKVHKFFGQSTGSFQHLMIRAVLFTVLVVTRR